MQTPPNCLTFFKGLCINANILKPFLWINWFNPVVTSLLHHPWMFEIPIAFKPFFINMDHISMILVLMICWIIFHGFWLLSIFYLDPIGNHLLSLMGRLTMREPTTEFGSQCQKVTNSLPIFTNFWIVTISRLLSAHASLIFGSYTLLLKPKLLFSYWFMVRSKLMSICIK